MTGKVEVKLKNFEYGLEALRGFAALIVVLSHIINYGKFIDPNYFPPELTAIYNGGHLMVLVFLVLSGYVIAISTRQLGDWQRIKGYLYKRLVRIYPIYALCICITLLVSSNSYSFFTVISNLAFLNVPLSNVLLDNGPIWSLHYEVIFYLLFIPISFYTVNPIKIGLISSAVGLANFFLASYTHTASLTSYCFGFVFWIAGVVIANYFVSKEDKATSYRRMLSYLFLLLTLPYFNSLSLIAEKLSFRYYGRYIEFTFDGNMNHWFKNAFVFLDLSYLLYCGIGVLIFANNRFKYKSIILLVLQLLPLYSIWNSMHYYPERFFSLVVPLSCYVVSWLLLTESEIFNQLSLHCIKFLTWVGGISYALYVIHVPLLFLFNKINLVSGTLSSYIFRVVVYLIVVLFMSYVIEKIFQPWIRNILLQSSGHSNIKRENHDSLLKN